MTSPLQRTSIRDNLNAMQPSNRKAHALYASPKGQPPRERLIRVTALERRSLFLVIFLFLLGMLTQALRCTQGRIR